MNKIFLIGRQANESELTFVKGKGTAVLKFSLAVDRTFKNADGSKSCDYFQTCYFGKGAEAVSSYMEKGKQLAITGRMEFGNYTDKDGVKKYTQTVMVEELQLLGSKKEATVENNDLGPGENFDDVPF